MDVKVMGRRNRLDKQSQWLSAAFAIIFAIGWFSMLLSRDQSHSLTTLSGDLRIHNTIPGECFASLPHLSVLHLLFQL